MGGQPRGTEERQARRPGGGNKGDAEGQQQRRCLMAAFPYYDTTALDALNGQAAALLNLFASRGYSCEEPALLQPAEIFLNRSGEEIRRRTFTLTDPSGRELALRPDLTIPICRQAVQANRAFPARISYNGLVFRHQPGEPH